MGNAFVRRFWFPIAYLLAMIPFWDFLTKGLQPFFQLYSAAVGVWLLKAIGVPVLREGFFIQLPNVQLEVAEACSGINNLIAVMCIGVPATLLLISRWRTRLLILLTAAAIALVSNGVRVAIVSLFAYNGLRASNGDIHGPYALFRSLVISGVGFLVLFALIFHFADKETPRRRPGAVMRRLAPDGIDARAVPSGGFLIAVLLLSSSLAVGHWHQHASVPPAQDFARFPQTIGPWRSLGPAPFGDAFDAMRFDDRISLDFARPDGRALNLRIGYFRDQGRGKKLAGWDTAKIVSERRRAAVRVEHPSFPVKDIIEPAKGHGRSHLTYWYIVGGIDLSDDYKVRLVTGFRSLFLGKSNGTFIVVTRQLEDSESLESSRAIVHQFIDAVTPILRRYLAEP
jgi:EpsI family protein